MIQRLADQAIMILKEGWFYDFEILEICKQVNREGYEQDPPDPNRNTNYCKTRAF